MDPTALGGRAGIARVRVRGTFDDALSARRRIERLIGAADLGDAGLPPGAIAIVRQLADPLPGTLPLDREQARPPTGWERALAAQVRSAVAQGAWPAHGPVPPDAPAVVFASAAEMWSCLALDLARGLAGLFWWWEGMARRGSLRAQLVARWLEQPELAPLALHRAARTGVAREVLALLESAQARVLAVRICERFGLPRLAAAVADVSTASGHDRAIPRGDRAAPLFAHVAPELLRVEAEPAPRALLAVALVVHRAPALARREELPAHLAHWLCEREPTLPDEVALPGDERREPTSKPRPEAFRAELAAESTLRAPVHDEEADSEVAPAPPVAPPGRASPAGIAPVNPQPHELPALLPPGAAAVAHDEALPPHPPSVHGQEGAGTGDAGSVVLMAEDRPALATRAGPSQALPQEAAPAPGETVHTHLGGAFYLLRLALWLELYGDFTQPRAPCLPLSPWDFVALLADRLLGGTGRDDALWTLLAALADRQEGAPPGNDFRQPDEYRVSRPWLAPFGRPPLAWDVSGGRLRLAHPAGFLALDAPASDAAAQAQSLGLVLGEREPIADPGGAGAQWYFARLAPYVEARLRAGLGLRAEDDLPGTLLRHEARVHLADGRVDVTFALATLPLRIRFAGLDQDVGWLPAAARSIAFHFE